MATKKRSVKRAQPKSRAASAKAKAGRTAKRNDEVIGASHPRPIAPTNAISALIQDRRFGSEGKNIARASPRCPS